MVIRQGGGCQEETQADHQGAGFLKSVSRRGSRNHGSAGKDGQTPGREGQLALGNRHEPALPWTFTPVTHLWAADSQT